MYLRPPPPPKVCQFCQSPTEQELVCSLTGERLKVTTPLPLLQKALQVWKPTLSFPWFSVTLRKKAGQGEVEGEPKSHRGGDSKNGLKAMNQLQCPPRAASQDRRELAPQAGERCLFCHPRGWQNGRKTGKPGPWGAGIRLERLVTRTRTVTTS